MSTRDFDALLAGRPTFTVAGQTFTAKAKLPWKKFSALLDTMTEDAADAVESTEKFFRMALLRRDRERFLALLDADDDDDDDDDADAKVISPADVRNITEYLMEHYTGKPEGSEQPSSDGPPTTGVQRNVVSLNPRKTA